jgi:diguanylate cyclase (GGDEF)-like protein/PAS domain S-box-containing protein
MSCIAFETTLRLALTSRLPVLSVSDGIEDLLGFKREDLLSSAVNLKDAIHPADAAEAEALFSALAQPKSGSLNLRFRRADGRIRVVKLDFRKKSGGDDEVVLELHLHQAAELPDPRAILTDCPALMNALDDFVYLKDRNHVIFWASEKTVRAYPALAREHSGLIGLTDYELLSESIADALYSEDEKILAGAAAGDAVAETGLGQDVQYRAALRALPVRNGHGETIALLTIGRDLTELRRAEEALLESQQALLESQRTAGIGSYSINMLDGTWIGSEVLCELFGIDATYQRTLEGWKDLIHPDERAFIAASFAVEVVGEGQAFDQVYRIIRRADRVERWVHGVGRLEFNRAGRLVCVRGTVQDITARKEHEQKLDRLAHYDALTGLPNWALLSDRLHQAMDQLQRRERWIALAYVDLDGFKSVNDNYGREVGDEFLQALSNRMQQVLRRGDTIARLGGDEFAVVVHDLQNELASVPTIVRLLNAVSEPMLIGDVVLQVSASIGVAYYAHGQDLSADQFMRQAGHAMYQAKLLGKNRYHIFDPVQDRVVRGHQETLERIHKAIEKNEFSMYYQPKVDMSLGKVVGVEALIRWQHPEQGLLPPAAFLPAIENHSLCDVLTEWIFGTVLAQIEMWIHMGLDIPVSINIGTRQIRQPDFVERLARLLSQHPLVSPSMIELEIKETIISQNADRLGILQEGCEELGVSIALQNFGAGTSSLQDLKESSAGVLKIDRGLVRDILNDPDERTILEGVLGLAAAFSRRSLAEGIESIEQGLAVLKMGCELAQGYGIAYPMPAENIPQWIASWQPDPRWSEALSEGIEESPLVYARAEHVAWMEALEAFLKGESDAHPQMGRHQCKLGAWLDAENLAGRGSEPEFQAIVALHWRIHALASGILKLKTQNRSEDALNRLGELTGLLEKMYEHLNVFRF